MRQGVGKQQAGYLEILVMKVCQKWVHPVCLYPGNIRVKYFSFAYLSIIFISIAANGQKLLYSIQLCCRVHSPEGVEYLILPSDNVTATL